MKNVNITIQNGIVEEIFNGDFDPAGFEKVLDARGYTVIPGLVDCHCHLTWTAPIPVCATYRLNELVLRAGVMSFEHATLMNEENAREIKEKGAWVCVCPQFVPNGGEKSRRQTPKPQLLGTPVHKQKVALADTQRGQMRQAELINKYDLNFVFGTDKFREEYPVDEPSDRQLADLRNFKKFFGSYKGLKAATGNAYEVSKLTTYQNPYPEGKIGILEKGSFADLLFVKGNPWEDLEILCGAANIRLVMKNGIVYRDSRQDFTIQA